MKITRKQLRRLIESTLNEYTTDKNAAKTWQSYVTKTNASHGDNLGQKVMDGWAELVDKGIIDASDQNYKSWVKWYRAQTEDETVMGLIGKSPGKHLSPQEVIDVYNRLIGLYAAENNVPEAPEIFAGMTDEEAQKIADDFNNAMEKETDEKKKSRLRKGYEWVRDNTGKEARQERRAVRQEKRAGKRGDVEDPRIVPKDAEEINKKTEPDGSEEDLRNQARQVVTSKPKGENHIIVVASQPAMLKQKAATKLGIPESDVKLSWVRLADNGKMIAVASDKNLNESLSRGSLYRRRYRRY